MCVRTIHIDLLEEEKVFLRHRKLRHHLIENLQVCSRLLLQKLIARERQNLQGWILGTNLTNLVIVVARQATFACDVDHNDRRVPEFGKRDVSGTIGKRRGQLVKTAQVMRVVIYSMR